MARSFKKVPHFSDPATGQWKRNNNRSFRRISQHMLNRVANGDDDAIDELPEDMNEVSDPWLGPQDGIKGFISDKEVETVYTLCKPHKMKGK